MNRRNHVDKGFLWGAATAAFQIEGSPLAEGACRSDWYKLSCMRGKIVSGDSAEITCDHYHRWPEDIRIMQELGLNAYRFSISWPRAFNGPGHLNQPGLDFYDRLIDSLCTAGITPFVTLFHWDMPEWLADKGGWLCDDSIEHYCEYAQAVFRRLHDRVNYWATFNEPYVYYYSYIDGWHWPLHTGQYGELFRCWDNILRAHHHASALCKSNDFGQIGLVHSYHLLETLSDSAEDRKARVRADGLRDRWFLDRICLGSYPQDIAELVRPYLPEQCHEPIEKSVFTVPDYLGLNYYSADKIRHDPEAPPLFFSSPKDEFELEPIVTGYPEGLYEMVQRVSHDYPGVDLYITENGYMEYESGFEHRDPTEDTGRQKYLLDHLEQVERCRRDGYPLRGYFHWSVLDNFEWRWGMNRRFGLVYVDKRNQDRTIKKSGYVYKNYIEKVRKNPIFCI